MDMQENWHTYWKNPGDSGGPIKVKWNYSNNILNVGEVLWHHCKQFLTNLS